MSLRILLSNVLRPALQLSRKRYLSFSFVGPKTLDDIMKKDKMVGKSASELSDLWFAYHDSKVRSAIYFTFHWYLGTNIDGTKYGNEFGLS